MPDIDSSAGSSFWSALDRLVAACQVVTDRPSGSFHPRFPTLGPYPLDYGRLKGTHANDGAELDCWIGSDPACAVTGVLLTVDLFKRDTEVKVLLGCTPEEMQAALVFSNTGPMSAALIPRPEQG